MYSKLLVLLIILSSFVYAREPGEKPKKLTIEEKLMLKELENNILNNLRYGKNGYAAADLARMKNISETAQEFLHASAAFAYVKHNDEEAMDYIYKGLKQNSKHESLIYLAGMIYARHNDWQKAMEFFEKASSLTYNPFYQINTTIAHIALGNTELAISSAKRTLELKPNFDQARVLLVALAMQTGNSGEAGKYCGELKQQNSDRNDYFLNCGRFYFQTGQYPKAAALLDKAKDLVLGDQIALADSLLHTGDYNNAYPVYQKIMVSTLRDQELLNNYVKCLVFLDRTIELNRILTKVYSNFPEMKDATEKALTKTRLEYQAKSGLYYQIKTLNGN